MNARTRALLLPIVALVAIAAQLPAAAATASDPPSPAAIAGGGDNVVIAMNRTDGRFAMQASLRVDRIPGPAAAPLNYALATSSCTDCQTLAVAIQLDFASTAAGYVAPQNVAVATNAGCLRCVTVAHAIQVFYTVDDPTAIPPAVTTAMRHLDLVLHQIAADPSMTLPAAEARIDAVVVEFLAAAGVAAEQRSVAAP